MVAPLSIQNRFEQQQKEKELAAKPKFLSKEERAKLAIERRKQEISEERQKEERLKAEREALEKAAEALHAPEHDGRHGRYDDRREEGRHERRDRRQDDRSIPPAYKNGIPTGPRASRGKAPPTAPAAMLASASAPNKGSPGPSASPAIQPATQTPPPNSHLSTSATSKITDVSSNFVPQMSETDISAIRSRYLGVDKKKRKIRKMNDRKFVFDWDEHEDTFSTESPLAVGSSRQGAQTMYGRGHLAGMDDEQRSGAVSAEIRHTDAMERRKAAKAGFDERHWTEKPLSEMKDRDWRIFREDFSISARGGLIPLPLRSWSESTIPPQILEVIEQVGYKEPSPIQRQAIPIGLQNRDLIGIAETGSGKTAAFVIPMLTYISHLPPFTDEIRHMGPYALILAPTRELAQQIEAETRKFAQPLGFHSVSIVGGRAVEEQQFNLREGAEIIIATPGRLKDVIERHVIVLSQCTYIVMDEADRMVNLGFEAELTFILDKLPSDTLEGEDTGMMMDVDGAIVRKGRTRVTALFSATMPPAVERLTRKYLKKPAIITIGEAGRAVDTVEQRVEFVNGEEKKKQRLLDVLNNEGFPAPIIVFVNQKKTADMVCRDLQRAGWRATTMHSGKTQEQREAGLQSLRSGDSDVLVATDLAGRGIDVQDVSLVINFQMANTIEAYVHRIGRTGRAGKQGVAITFLTNEDDEVMYDLKQEISKSPISKVPVELAKHPAAQARVTREMKRKRGEEEEAE